MPEGTDLESGFCPICDFKVGKNATKCPECKADLTVFGVKSDDDASYDVKIPEYKESLEKLLGDIGRKDEKKERELFEEIMAAVDKTDSMADVGGAVQQTADKGLEEKAKEVEEKSEEGTVMFECPLCNTLVGEDAKSCPGCGAIFAEDEEEVTQEEDAVAQKDAAPSIEEAQAVEEVEVKPMEEVKAKAPPPKVPEKKRAPPPVTAQPPREGVKDERALRKELGALVAEVKPLLTGARRAGINVTEGRKWIDQAITAGKNRDFQRAIIMVKKSKNALNKAINQQTIDMIQTTQKKIEVLKRAGTNVNQLENNVLKITSLLKGGGYVEAAQLAKNTVKSAEKSMMVSRARLKKTKEVKGRDEVDVIIKSLIDMIKSGEEINVNTKLTKAFLTKSRLAMKKDEWNEARDLLLKAKENFLKELSQRLTDIVSNSRPVLYKAKMEGVDIRPSIKLLREASSALKVNKYLDGLEVIKLYMDGMRQYMDES